MKTKVVQHSAKNNRSTVVAPIIGELGQILPLNDAAKEMGEYFYQNIPIKHFIEWVGISIESLVSCEQTNSDKRETITNLSLLITYHIPDMLECKNSSEFKEPVVYFFNALFAKYNYAKSFFIITCKAFLDCHNDRVFAEPTITQYLRVNAHLLLLCEMYSNYKYLSNEESIIKKQVA